MANFWQYISTASQLLQSPQLPWYGWQAEGVPQQWIEGEISWTLEGQDHIKPVSNLAGFIYAFCQSSQFYNMIMLL